MCGTLINARIENKDTFSVMKVEWTHFPHGTPELEMKNNIAREFCS